MYRCENIEKKFEDFILSIDNFCLNKGEIVAVLGKVGSGKSTFIKTISSLIHPDKGEIYLDEIPVKDKIKYLRNQFSVLPDDDYFYHFMKVSEFTSYIRKSLNLSQEEYEAKSDWFNKFFRISNLENKKISACSFGEKMIIKLFLSVLKPFRCFFIDDPFQSLGGRDATKVLELLTELKDKGAGIVIATSHPVYTESFDRFIILENGNISGNYTIDDIKTLSQEKNTFQTITQFIK